MLDACNMENFSLVKEGGGDFRLASETNSLEMEFTIKNKNLHLHCRSFKSGLKIPVTPKINLSELF